MESDLEAFAVYASLHDGELFPPEARADGTLSPLADALELTAAPESSDLIDALCMDLGEMEAREALGLNLGRPKEGVGA